MRFCPPIWLTHQLAGQAMLALLLLRPPRASGNDRQRIPPSAFG